MQTHGEDQAQRKGGDEDVGVPGKEGGEPSLWPPHLQIQTITLATLRTRVAPMGRGWRQPRVDQHQWIGIYGGEVPNSEDSEVDNAIGKA
jgi:hypothetical protein